MLSKTLPKGPNKPIVGFWSKLPDLVEKKIALWNPDSPEDEGWTFIISLDKTNDEPTNSRKRRAGEMTKEAEIED